MKMFQQLTTGILYSGEVWCGRRKQENSSKRLPKFSLLEKLYRVDKKVSTHRHISEEKKMEKKKSNLCKLMKIYLSAHENHLMFPAVNIYSKN